MVFLLIFVGVNELVSLYGYIIWSRKWVGVQNLGRCGCCIKRPTVIFRMKWGDLLNNCRGRYKIDLLFNKTH